MKALVLGAGGMAGHMISVYLTEKNHEVTGFARRSLSFCDTVIGDARNQELLRELISENHFDCVVNAIGSLNQDAEQDKVNAVYLNSFLPHFLAYITHDTNTQLIHISTDCVFSGKKGHYEETDVSDATSFYGKTKALGEVVDDKNLTIRTSIIGPDINANGIGLFHWFMNQQDTVKGYKNVLWTGVTTLTLAKAILELYEKDVTGLYHLVNAEKISKLELLNLFNCYFRDNSIKITESEDIISDKSLIGNRELFHVPTYEEMIKELKEWVDVHPNLYHYDGGCV